MVFAVRRTSIRSRYTSFTRDIKGLLSNRCIRCHGPDAEARHGGGEDGLRLDIFEGATEDLGGYAIVPGDADQSELIIRVTAKDTDLVMPPPEAGEPLSDKERALLRQWINSGAEYEPHWAYTRISRPVIPNVVDTSWPRNPIDRFILAKLESEGLKPSQEADRMTLARRLALDLTGLPVSPEQVDQFVADVSKDAFEKFVDALLSHPGYGEHMAEVGLISLDMQTVLDTRTIPHERYGRTEIGLSMPSIKICHLTSLRLHNSQATFFQMQHLTTRLPLPFTAIR